MSHIKCINVQSNLILQFLYCFMMVTILYTQELNMYQTNHKFSLVYRQQPQVIWFLSTASASSSAPKTHKLSLMMMTQLQSKSRWAPVWAVWQSLKPYSTGAQVRPQTKCRHMTSWQKSKSLDGKTVRPGVVQTQSSSLFCCHVSPSHSRVPPTPPPLYFLCLCRTIWGVQLKANVAEWKKNMKRKRFLTQKLKHFWTTQRLQGAVTKIRNLALPTHRLYSLDKCAIILVIL